MWNMVAVVCYELLQKLPESESALFLVLDVYEISAVIRRRLLNSEGLTSLNTEPTAVHEPGK